jgi:hypothetical protein
MLSRLAMLGMANPIQCLVIASLPDAEPIYLQSDYPGRNPNEEYRCYRFQFLALWFGKMNTPNADRNGLLNSVQPAFPFPALA